MSEIYEYDDQFEFSGRLSEEELDDIIADYKRRQLIEHLTGPVISTLVHFVLIIFLIVFLVFPAQDEEPEVEATVIEEEVVELEEPVEVVEIPVETEDVKTDSPTPDVTTPAIETDSDDVSMEDVSDDIAETDDALNMEEVSDVKIMDTSLKTTTLFGGRTNRGRASAVKKYGGSQKGQDALLRALHWLRDNQNPDGTWSNKAHAAMTGLAVLTFLAHGETPSSKKFGKCVSRGIKALVNLSENKGKLRHGNGYAHAIAAYGLAEAYAMTGISDVGIAMDGLIKTIIEGQMDNGGFAYNYDKSSKRNDLSISGWNYQALKAAYTAGCEIEGLGLAIKKSIANLEERGSKNFPYAGDKSGAGKPSMRAVGALCMQLLGEVNNKHVIKATDTMIESDIKKLNWEKRDLYAWYYATQACFNRGGDHWKVWNKRFEPVLLKNQKKDGHWTFRDGQKKGHVGGMEEIGTKVYATTLCALMLTVYYRYLPGNKIKSTKVADKDQEGINLKIE